MHKRRATVLLSTDSTKPEIPETIQLLLISENGQLPKMLKTSLKLSMEF